MSDYEIGYGKPPKASQFKPGFSGNPKGRAKRQPAHLVEVISKVLDAPIRHQDGGHEKTSPVWELNLRMWIRRALLGDVDAALAVLNFWKRAGRSTASRHRIEVQDWPPDYPGQTAEEKTRDFERKRDAATVEWWAS